MARTETISLQVHPADERTKVKVMETFHWSVLSSQDVKTVDRHLEQRGDDIYSVKTTETYVKLTFSRDLDTPNLNKIKQLEREYESLTYPTEPTLFPISIWIWIILCLFYGIGAILWALYFFLSYKPNKEAYKVEYSRISARQFAILQEASDLDTIRQAY